MRYALDALGWHEFEHLVQTLLKTRLGLGVEAWGGAGDWGRDAYFTGSLPYPTHEPREGTFCFQCKFVEEANAAGARPEKALVDAVRRERDRLRYGRSQATIYVLFTNAPLSPSVREKVTALLSEVMPTVAVRLHDGNDVCAWLDESPQIARRFPQLFSLRDLDILLGQWVNRDLLARSQAAIEEARDLAQVFVPTGAYHEALSVLGKHHFVVLEGPPEMGKTAIGRMIALAQVLQGWEALECRRARDVERAVTDEREQVFLADDFFGRGEYVPTAVSEWEAELPHILRLLGPRRKLILTSRAHLLNLAKRDLDLHGVAAQRFPTLGEVIVDAGRLTSQEKARILYRHLKQAGLPLAIRELLRSCAHEVVHDEHFTPERIRRLAAETLPNRIQVGGEQMTAEEMTALLEESLRNPSKGMEVSFRKLKPSHKWLLIALAETDGGRSGDDSLSDTYSRLCPSDDREPFRDAERALSQAFIKPHGAYVDEARWVHPSCRDLTIRELATDGRLRGRFLSQCSLRGVALAISIGGGPQGGVAVPLLTTDDDWSTFTAHVIELMTASPAEALVVICSELAVIVANDAAPRVVRQKLEAFVGNVFLPQVVSLLNERAAWTLPALKLCLKMMGEGAQCPQLQLAPFWEALTARALDAIALETDHTKVSHVSDWTTAYALLDNNPHVALPALQPNLQRLLDKACALSIPTRESFADRRSDEAANRFRSLSHCLEELAQLPALHQEVLDALKKRAIELSSLASYLETPDHDESIGGDVDDDGYDDDGGGDIFSDL